MSFVNRTMTVLTAGLGGVTAGLVLSSHEITDSLIDPSASLSSVAGIGSGVVAMAVVAVVAVSILGRVSSARIPVAMAALIVLAVDVPLDGLPGWISPVAAGALVGALAAERTDAVSLQGALVLGLLGGGLFGSRLDDVLVMGAINGSDSVIMGYDPIGEAESTRDVIFLVLVCLAAAALIASRIVNGPEAIDTPGSAVAVAVGIGLPIVGSTIGWASTAYRSQDVVWYLCLVGLAVAALVAALILPGRNGSVVLALFATTGAALGSGHWVGVSAIQLGLVIALFVAGGVLGARFPQVYVGLALLVATALSALLLGPSTGTASGVAAMYLLPFTAAYTIVAVLPVGREPLVVAMFVPFTLTVSVTMSFGYTGGAGYVFTESFVGSSNPSREVLSLCGVLVVLFCAGGIALLRRRELA